VSKISGNFLLDLHREINSPSMMEHRVKTQVVLINNKDTLLEDINDGLQDDLISVWALTGFYERLYYTIKFGTLNVKESTVMFAPLFLLFMEGYFRQQLVPCSWELGKVMEQLERILKQNADKADWAAWLDQAKRDAKGAHLRYRANSAQTSHDIGHRIDRASGAA
jgi:hypothetical protein